MKCLELHVQWKVYTLTRVMREAGRVPSRMRFLKEACGGNGDDFRNFLKMRNDTIETCSRGLRRCAPKVKLEPLKSSERLSSESTPTDLCSKNQLFLSNWTCSFAAVLMLLSLSPDNPTEYHQERPQIEADFALDDVSLSPNELQSKDVTSEEIKCPLTVTLKSETVGVSVDGSEIWIAGESSENHDSSPSPYDNDRNSNYDSAPDNDECNELGIRTHTQTVCKEKPKLTIVASEDGSEFRNADGSTDNCEHETSSNDDWNSNSGSVHDVGESIELETGNLIACKEEFYEVGGEASHADNLEVIDNQATLDSKDFSKLAEAVPTTSGGRINTNSFRCTKCFKYFPKKHSLNLHVSKKHPEMRVINKPSPYSCELCVTGYSSYHSYLVHKRTFSHRQKLNKKSTSSKVNMTADEKPIEIQALINVISPADNDAKTSPLESESQERIVETKYNLRTNRRYPIKSMDVESNEGVATSDDEDVASDFDSSGSLSSSSNVSIKSGNDDEIPRATTTKRRRGGRVPKGPPILRCSSNTCKKYFTYFKKAHVEHMNLHKPGQYQCKFCEVINSNAFDLSIHELKIHSDSKKPSRKRIGVRVYHCPRCEYFTQFRLGYTNHFAQQHLGFTRESRYEACPICQVKLIDHRQGSHFRRFHDTTGVEPNKILKCTEENCTAYFTRKNAWSRHKREIHMEKALLQTCDDEGNQPDGKLHCQICARNFQSEYRLKIHKYLFHNKTKDPGSTKGIKTNHLGAFICPALECTKTFRRIELFDRHRKLHGSFKCHFCEVVKEYAPDLALHEMEQHSSLEGVKKAFKCSRCPFTSTQLSATEYVTHHLEAHQGQTDRLYSCGICKMRLRSNRDKRIHIIAYHHTDQIDPKAVERCDKCPAYFLTEKQLRRHKQYFCNKATKVLHPGTGRPVKREQYECSTSECVESFDNPKSLELHQKLHGSFKCQFCSTSKKGIFKNTISTP